MSSKRGNSRSRDERLYKALSHPLRFKILTKLSEGPASPSDLAEELGEKVGNVAYHVRTLLELETVELLKTEQVRGTLEHYYRATVHPSIDDAHWTRLPVSIRRQFADSILDGVWEHTVEASESGAFDGPDSHVSSTVLDLDDEGREEVKRILAKALDDVIAARTAAAGREAKRSPDERQSEPSELAVMYFPRPESGG
jgi:DNA-binding transcriptional ArsR family regulator